MSLRSDLPPKQGRSLGRVSMSRVVRNVGTAMVALMLAGSVSFAQSSTEALYKSKCQMCHGEKGMADSAAGKAMKVKPVSDPDVKKMSEAQMVEAVKNGMGKMQPYKDKLSDAQIKDVVNHFRTFLK